MQHACTLPLPLCTLLPSTPSLRVRFPHFPPAPSPSQLQPPTATHANRPAPWSRLPTYPATATATQLQPLTATQPPSLHLHEQRTHRKPHFKPLHTHSHRPSQANHATLPYFTNLTLLYQPYLTIPYIPYQPHLGELSEAFLSSPSPSPFPTISPYPITRVKE